MGLNFFYRKVSDLISLVNTGVPVFPDEDPDSEEGRARIYSFDNVGNGKVYGFEFDLSAPLSVIGLEDTGVFANYTRLWSKRTEPNTGLKVPFDGQPKYVYNFGMTQEIPTVRRLGRVQLSQARASRAAPSSAKRNSRSMAATLKLMSKSALARIS